MYELQIPTGEEVKPETKNSLYFNRKSENMELFNKVSIIKEKLTALHCALKLLFTADEFTLSVFDKENNHHVVFCNHGEEINIIRKSTAVQMYMLENLIQKS